MNLYRVTDVELEEIAASGYDLAIFASGYEERCTYAPEQLQRRSLRTKSVILGFKEMSNDPQRIANDRYFSETWNDPIPLSTEDDGPVYELLRNEFGQDKTRLRILVDYSSMSSLWYTAVLNWARFFPGHGEIWID